MYRVLFLMLAGMIIFPLATQAQQNELKVLFVGNSYTFRNNLPLIAPRTFMTEDASGETLRLMGADPLDYEFCKRITYELMGK